MKLRVFAGLLGIFLVLQNTEVRSVLFSSSAGAVVGLIILFGVIGSAAYSYLNVPFTKEQSKGVMNKSQKALLPETDRNARVTRGSVP